MGRRDLASFSWEEQFEHVAHTEATLELSAGDGNAEARPLAVRLQQILAQWDRVDGDVRKARRAVSRAMAQVRWRDAEADRLVRALHVDVLAHIKQDRAHPLFARLFPTGLADVVRPGLAEELPDLRRIHHELTSPESIAPAALRKAHAQPLQDEIARGEAAVREREQAEQERSRIEGQKHVWTRRANAEQLFVEGALQQLAARSDQPASSVDSFFKKVAKRVRPPGEPPAPMPPQP